MLECIVGFSGSVSEYKHANKNFKGAKGVATPTKFTHKTQQVAQLSQRDRAAGWVSNGQKWKTGTDRQYLRTYSTTATYLASKEIEIGEKTQNKGCYAV